MPSLTVVEPAVEPVRFHLSLNVPDLGRAVEFYTLLFGQPPAKRHHDYAKFDLTDPPVVFSLAPIQPGPGNTLSHLGLRVSSDGVIDQYRERLQAAGIGCEDQTGTTCGYARQNKLWVSDPFGNFWEVYRVEEDVRPELVRTSLNGKAARVDTEAAPAEVVWEHYVTPPPRDGVPHADATVDEVRLTGTFNGGLTDEQRQRVTAEAFRVVKPGGKVVVHGLMADRPFPGPPKLPGLASLVQRVPVEAEPLDALRTAGFVGLQYEKLGDIHRFRVNGVELRELRLHGWKPTPSEVAAVVYKGPFAEATGECGTVFRRGEVTLVSPATVSTLCAGPAAESFALLLTP